MRQVGDRLGRYTLLKRLAIGGMGEVFVAAKPGPVGFGPYVALKILRDELATDQQFVDMLVDEANISMFLNHQNVVSVLDLSEDAGAYYIAMEYVQGITVERLVDALVSDGRSLSIPYALYIAVELCRALKYAHTRVNHDGEPLNIVHRDVTPANILLSIQGEVKLTDFGIARARGRIHQTQAGVLKGKFGYMAPEMVRYERLDARADLFCAGVVMYLMLAGRHPVAGAAVMEAIQRFEQKRIPPPSHYNPEIPAPLDTIVMRALEPQPDHRWGSAAALGDALRDVMLQNPEWRKHAKDGGQRLAQLIRELAPEEFDPPVPADTLASLLEAADPNRSPLPIAFSRSETTDADGPTDSRLPALDESGAPMPELETDDRLAIDEVFSAQEALKAERDGDASPDSGADTAATPVAGQALIVDFPESQFGRNRQQDDLLAEPALPADPHGGPRTNGSEATEAAYQYADDATRADRPDTDRDDRTVVNAPDDAFESVDLDAGPTLDVPRTAEDGRTVAGAFVGSAVDDPSSHLPQILDSLPEGAPLPEEDASTVIPLLDGIGETDRQVPMSPTSETENFAEATLLDGIDAAEVRAAMEAGRSNRPAVEPLSPWRPAESAAPDEATDATEAGDDGHPALDAVTIEADRDEVRNRPAYRVQSGVQNLRPSIEEPDPPPSPARLQMNTDGVLPAVVDRDALSGPVTSTETPAAPREDLSAPIRPEHVAPGHPRPDPSSAVSDLQAAAWDGPEGSTQRPAASIPRAASPGVGTNTGRWMAGEIDANALSWDDEAAARRAVATRDNAPMGHPQYATGTPRPTQATHTATGSQGAVLYPPTTFWQRNSMLLGTMVVAVGLIAGLAYAIMFTQVFWPRLKLSSEPPGAQVLVDGVEAPGRTPLVVQVEPERRHRIEFRLKGHQRTLREITEGIGRAKTYTLTVRMERLPPKILLPVAGRVLLNGRLVGRGREVSLAGVSQIKGAVRLRVEADEHEPYEVEFLTHDEIPSSLDVPLRKKSLK